MTKKHILRIYRWITGVSAVIAGICLILACIGIYRSGGDAPFYTESVVAAFQKIAIPIYITLAIVVGGIVLEAFLPAEKERNTPDKQYTTILEKLHSKLDGEQCPAEAYAAIKKESKRRKVLSWVTLGILVVCSVLFLCYGLNIHNFPKGEATAAVSKAMWYFIPSLLIPFGFAVYAAYAKRRSIIREIDLVKSALVGSSTAAQAETAKAPKQNVIHFVRYGILALAVFLIVFGWLNHGYDEVLAKAVAICRECVGLG